MLAFAVAAVEFAIADQVYTSCECLLSQPSRDVTGSRGSGWVRDGYAVTLPETQARGYLVRRREGMAVDRSIGGFRRGEQAFTRMLYEAVLAKSRHLSPRCWAERASPGGPDGDSRSVVGCG